MRSTSFGWSPGSTAAVGIDSYGKEKTAQLHRELGVRDLAATSSVHARKCYASLSHNLVS